MPLRRTHSDRRIHQLLNGWGAVHDTPAAVTARRVFRDYAEFQEFFRVAFPGNGPVTAAGVTRAGRAEISVVSVLESLAEMEVKQHQLQAATYLVREGDRATQLAPEARKRQLDGLQTWLDMFEDVPTDVLPTLLWGVPWQDLETSRWSRECYDAGVTPEYVRALNSRLLSPVPWPPAPWPPELVARYESEDAPAEYLLLLWHDPERFASLWSNGVPFEYAAVMEDEAR